MTNKGMMEKCRLAYQPIVEMASGKTFGFEALLRGTRELGYQSIHGFFDDAYREGRLYQTELALREKAFQQLQDVPLLGQKKLFLNMDNRLLESPDYSPGNTHRLLEKYGIPADQIVFEISERHSLTHSSRSRDILAHYRRAGYRIALDDYGTGYAGMILLYHSEPDIIKIDRFFIDGVAGNPKKRLFVAHIIEIAHLLGSRVIAEGVETEEEFTLCRNLGADLVQGWYIAKALEDTESLRAQYFCSLPPAGSRQEEPGRTHLLSPFLDTRQPLEGDFDPRQAVDYFRNHPQVSLVPLVNRRGEPLGILEESRIKNYLYSPYGHALLQNQGIQENRSSWIRPVPAVEEYTPLDHILTLFADNPELPAILVTRNRRYRGVLDTQTLIQMLNEREIREARDLNPLSRLPGNQRIADRLAVLERQEFRGLRAVYFDFDSFKPFNDHFGFRQGDRLIRRFAERLREFRGSRDWFIGHIGGDDFLLLEQQGREASRDSFLSLVEELCRTFAEDARMFYGAEETDSRGIPGVTRDGADCFYPPLTVSAAVLLFPPEGLPGYRVEDLSAAAARLKKRAKASSEPLAVEEAGAIFSSPG